MIGYQAVLADVNSVFEAEQVRHLPLGALAKSHDRSWGVKGDQLAASQVLVAVTLFSLFSPTQFVSFKSPSAVSHQSQYQILA